MRCLRATAPSDPGTSAEEPGRSALSIFSVVPCGSGGCSSKPGLTMSIGRGRARGRCMRAQRARERCEVAPWPGAELPVVVDRAADHLFWRRCQRPRRRERLAATRSVSLIADPEAGLAAQLERRHDARDVIGVRDEHARTHQPRQLQVRRPVQRSAHVRLGCCPRRQPVRAPTPSSPSRSGSSSAGLAGAEICSAGSGASDRGAERHAVLLAHDDETQPRPQLRVRVGAVPV